MAQDWRKDPTLQKLEAMLIAINETDILLISGNGEVITPDTLAESGDQVIAVGSGGNFAQAAATALILEGKPELTAEQIVETGVNIAGGIDVYTNHNVIVESF